VFEIGSSLREARLRQQLDFPELEQAIKIRAKYLRALEDEQFETLPAPTYVKGFLRSYADALGLDGQLYVDEFNSRYLAGDEEWAQPRARRRSPAPRPERRVVRNTVVLALIGIAVVTALVIAAWKFGGPDSQDGAFKGLTARSTVPAAPSQGTAPQRRVRLVLRAVRGSSWIQVHAGSATGRVLYQGTLERGQRQTFVSRRLWLRVGRPAALSAKLNGNRVRLPGSKPTALVVTPRGVRSATSA
jgi:hypothetical protein